MPFSGTLGTALNKRTKVSTDLVKFADSFSFSHLIKDRSASR